MQYEYVNVNGNMSIRPAPNTNNSPIGQLPKGVMGYGSEVYNYPNGDKWVKIEGGGSAVGWVAVIHLGAPYGVLKEVEDFPTEPPVTPPVPNFPQKFTLIDESGNKAEYAFMRVL